MYKEKTSGRRYFIVFLFILYKCVKPQILPFHNNPNFSPLFTQV